MATLAITATRVRDQTDPDINRRIDHQTEANVAYFARHPEQIEQRLCELDQEWDVDRWLATNSAALSLTGLVLSAMRHRGWLILPVAVQAFFLQHGTQGWCPPLPLFRRLGVRTELEIQSERYALRMIRGDFASGDGPQHALEAARIAAPERVAENTPDSLNQCIERQTERRLAFHAEHPELIDQRLDELEREWDIERLIETEAPATTLAGILISALFGRGWLILPLFVQSMVLTHALHGFYPLLNVFRRLGVRTQSEIGIERYALKILRGDFKQEGDATITGRHAYGAAQPVSSES